MVDKMDSGVTPRRDSQGAGEDAVAPLCRRVIVSGRVQGVGFRQAARGVAERRGVAGWVRNRRDGRVEAVLEGPPGEVVALIEWFRHGPPMAKVSEVEVFEESPGPLSGFRIAPTA